MLQSDQHIRELAAAYDVPVEDVLLIALNASGVQSNLAFPRARFKLRLHSRPDEAFYAIVSLGRSSSPFFLADDSLMLHGIPIAKVSDLENDDVVISYFRNGRSILTLNSNARSHCTGCVFCYNTLETTSDPHLRTRHDLHNYARLIARDYGDESLASLSEIVVCTGCFNEESAALDHLVSVREVFTHYGFRGSVGFLSSVIRSEEGFDRIAMGVAPFHLTLTIECFTGRADVLKQSKSDLDLPAMVNLLRRAKRRGFETDFTYIVGLDDFESCVDGLRRLSPFVTSFPRLQVYQAHNAFMDAFRTKEAGNIEYYLRIRKKAEAIFKDTGIRPQSYQNYRPLWYFAFADEGMFGPRI